MEEFQQYHEPVQPSKVRILIADDHPLLRQALTHSLSIQPDFEVIAEAVDGEEALRLALELVPDVAILDIVMPKLNGLEVTRKIKEACPSIAVLILTIYDDNEHVMSTLEAGAAGYLTKNASDKDVILALRAIANGEMVVSPNVMQQIIMNTPHYMKQVKLNPHNVQFSVREEQILRCVARGKPNKEIALELDLSVRTVKSYLESIFSKLQVSSRTEAIVLCLRSGLLTIEELYD